MTYQPFIKRENSKIIPVDSNDNYQSNGIVNLSSNVRVRELTSETMSVESYDTNSQDYFFTQTQFGRTAALAGLQVQFRDSALFPSFRVKRDPESVYMFPPIISIDIDGVYAGLKYIKPVEEAQKTVITSGTTNMDAVYDETDSLYKLSTLTTTTYDLIVWRKYLTTGNTNPTANLRVRIWEGTGETTDDKLGTDLTLPVSLFTGKTAGTEICYSFNQQNLCCEIGAVAPAGARGNENYYTLYSSTEPFSLYGNGTLVNNAIDKQKFIFEYIDSSGELGEIKQFALSISNAVTKSTLQSRGWAICDGTTPESQGVSDATITTTPNLEEKFIRMSSDETSGNTGGEATHTLTIAEMPAHTHEVDCSVFAGTAADARCGGENGETFSTNSTGGGEAHNNLPPYYELVYFIKVR
ncbi:MAG: hypothetical protein AMJ43_07750 [Coxiella sp. DG_40]|nr:MAG: hypothetical protein AMJ43_07750 [Coxiella sp. DG_40]